MRLVRDAGKQSSDPSKESYLVRLSAGRGNYWFCFITDPVVVGLLLFWEVAVLGSSMPLVLASFSVGAFSFSLVEYSVHRWIFHHGHTVASIGHMQHHQSPQELKATPWFMITTLMVVLCYPLACYFRLHFIASCLAGMLTGFVGYGVFHHSIHHFQLKSRWYRKLRADHLIHHQYPSVNFGVSSRLWDNVFGTVYRKEIKQAARQTDRI